MFLFDFKHRIMAKANRELEKILDSNERKNSTDCYKIKWPIFQLHLVIFLSYSLHMIIGGHYRKM